MNILIISDSHGLQETIDRLLAMYPSYMVLHAGDYTIDHSFLDDRGIVYVRGNCDRFGADERIIENGKDRIFLTHGNLYDVKYSLMRLYYTALEKNATIAVFGHTHEQLLLELEGIHLLNPGSLKNGYYALIEDGHPILKKL